MNGNTRELIDLIIGIIVMGLIILAAFAIGGHDSQPTYSNGTPASCYTAGC